MPRNRLLFTAPLVAAMLVLTLVIGLVVGRATLSARAGGTAGRGTTSGLRIDVIVKATDSSFWQSMFAGAQKAGADLGVEVGRFGPTSETDVNEQVQLVENSISRGVNAIVLAANSTSALNKAIDRARQAGIKVITVDGTVSTRYEAFIGTDNLRAGEQAGTRLCQLIAAQGQSSGKVLLENAVAGVQALGDRAKGFRQGIAATCPGVTVWAERYNNNDIATAANQTNDALSAVPDLVGIFAANNVSGDGVARAVKDTGRAATLPVVAFDSDPQENTALADRSIEALVVQNPYFFGYQGVVEAMAVSAGAKVPLNLDPGAVLVDQSNMNDPAVQDLLHPPTAKASR